MAKSSEWSKLRLCVEDKVEVKTNIQILIMIVI